MNRRTHERHKLTALSWLRASVLGANDGIVSISSLLLGVAAARASHANILLSGVAALVAGAMSMAVGEYVSMHSQADSEAAALAQERAELEVDPVGERHELTDIYRRRGLSSGLARQVAEQLMAHDALAAHAHDELGFSARSVARPLQAALASAASFADGCPDPVACCRTHTSVLCDRGHRHHLARVSVFPRGAVRQGRRRAGRRRSPAGHRLERARHGSHRRRRCAGWKGHPRLSHEHHTKPPNRLRLNVPGVPPIFPVFGWRACRSRRRARARYCCVHYGCRSIRICVVA